MKAGSGLLATVCVRDAESTPAATGESKLCPHVKRQRQVRCFSLSWSQEPTFKTPYESGSTLIQHV